MSEPARKKFRDRFHRDESDDKEVEYDHAQNTRLTLIHRLQLGGSIFAVAVAVVLLWFQFTTLALCLAAIAVLLTWGSLIALAGKLELTEDMLFAAQDTNLGLRPLEQLVEKKNEKIRALEAELEALGVARKQETEEQEERVNQLEEALKEEKLQSKKSRDELRLQAGTSFIPYVSPDEKSEEVDVVEIAKNCVERLNAFAKSNGIRINVSVQEEKILTRGNRERYRVMFSNIIDNSIKYMGRSGLLTIVLGMLSDDIFIVLKDNGRGLSERETEHIFEMNYQGSNRVSGNGLGLTQSKAIVEYYGGTIYARSADGDGMAIYIQIPQRR